MELYSMIRSMTSDARMISLNTDVPQYKIAQLKLCLFLASTQPVDNDICLWWMRLFDGDYDSEDLKVMQHGFKLYNIE